MIFLQGEGQVSAVEKETNYCKTGYFRGHVIFAVFAVDRQSAKINDRDKKIGKIGKIEKSEFILRQRSLDEEFIHLSTRTVCLAVSELLVACTFKTQTTHNKLFRASRVLRKGMQLLIL